MKENIYVNDYFDEFDRTMRDIRNIMSKLLIKTSNNFDVFPSKFL